MNTVGKISNQQGFTLIEVLVALSILSIGILAVVGVQYRVVNGNTNGNVITQELNLARRIMEQQKIASNPTTLSDSVLNNVDDKGESSGPYNVKIIVSNPMGGTASRFIIVTVTRNGGVGGHEISLRSLTQGNGI